MPFDPKKQGTVSGKLSLPLLPGQSLQRQLLSPMFPSRVPECAGSAYILCSSLWVDPHLPGDPKVQNWDLLWSSDSPFQHPTQPGSCQFCIPT